MTAKTRADIQTEIDALLPDNTAGDISPLDVRTVHETSKDSNLNLTDVSGTQSVLGVTDFTGAGGLLKDGVEVMRLPSQRKLILTKAELPAPATGVITLADNIEYVQGASFSLGTDRIVLGDGTAYKGIESIITTLTYTGTGDMFTSVDKTIRISNLSISCANGRVFNCSTASQKILRFTDISIVSADEYALFTGVNMIIRMTNVSPSSLTTGGITFAGSFRSFLYEVSAVTINGGTLFDLSTATFDAFNVNDALITLNAGTSGFSGLAASANISAGGIASVFNNRFNGAGTPLSTISVDDALWQFLSNDDIADTRPDGLLSMQANATATVIAVAGTPVLTAGTWVVERTSQMTGTTGGRITHGGGKAATLPITASLTVVPVSGGTVDLSVEIAVNGTVVPNSKRTASASSGNPTSVTVPWQEIFTSTDFVEVFVTNEDSTANVLVSSAILRVN